MEQRLRLYRNHTPACIHGYRKPIFEGENSTPDCTCPINATGYLQHETAGGKSKRIQHRSLETKDWKEARRTAELWLQWGQTTQPASGLDRLKTGKDVTIQEAVEFFFEFSAETSTRGANTTKKYRNLLRGRLIPWCALEGVRFISEFDSPITTRKFFMSWKKNKFVRTGLVVDLDEPLAIRTKAAELERYRAFLAFCHGNGWTANNWALAKPAQGKKGIPTPSADVEPKIAFTEDEYSQILKTLDGWKDEYGRANQPKGIMIRAFCSMLRYCGQRVSDVSMLGPHSLVKEDGMYFIELVQIKTGNRVKVPIQHEQVEMLRALPFRGVRPEPFVLKTNNRTIRYGTQFWFWTGRTHENGGVSSNIQQWLDDVSSVLEVCQATYGKFEHHPTPHSFRHFFAVYFLNHGVDVKKVSKWLGHSSIETTEASYTNANNDWHRASHHDYMKALEGTTPKGKIIKMRSKVG